MAENVFSNKDIEKLIEIWHGEEHLWNIPSEVYQKKETKANALDRIREDLDNKFTVEQINTKIRNLRCYYARELSKQKKGMKSGAGRADVYKSKWRWFESLDGFLREQIVPRPSQSSWDIGSQSVEYETDESMSSRDSSFSQPQEIPQKKRRTRLAEAMMDKAGSMLSSMQDRSASSQSQNVPVEDEDLMFAKHITNDIKKITNPRDKALLKIKIQSLIFETLYQTNQPSTNVASVKPTTYEAASKADQNSYSNPLSQLTQFMPKPNY